MIKEHLNNKWTRGLGVVIIVLFVAVYFYRTNQCDCVARISYKDINLNQGMNIDSLLRPIDNAEVAKTMKDWSQFNLESDSFKVIKSFAYNKQRKLVLVQHFFAGDGHYGAIILPEDYDKSKKYPLLIWANGLNQSNPSVDLFKRSEIQALVGGLQQYFIVVPSFRGQALVINQHRYCSDGFFGDAFDGATDDALRLMHLTKINYPAVDSNRLAVYGVSRGGTVAMLAGIRYPSLHCVAAQTGPSDFLLKSVYRKFGMQYKYQFLSQALPLSSLRTKIIKSSPAHFISYYPNNLLLVYGEQDGTVGLENATFLLNQLQEKKNIEHVFLKAGHNFDYVQPVMEWLKKYN
ncbi:MAG: prolyl oligopeptidase family serine peptidase [Saprospiraceae bacterium]